MSELVIFGAIVIVALVAGLTIGMLAAPRLTRLADSNEEASDRDDPTDD